MRSREQQPMKNVLTFVCLAWTSRLIISAAFLYAGITKLADPKSLAVVIDGYGLLPDPLVIPVAVALPPLEIIAALGLLLNIRICLYVVFGMMVLFIGVLGYGIWLGLDVDCGCFGSEDPEQAYHGLRAAFFRDLGFLVPILYLFWFQRRMGRRKRIPSNK